jgi:hypothetical protein
VNALAHPLLVVAMGVGQSGGKLEQGGFELLADAQSGQRGGNAEEEHLSPDGTPMEELVLDLYLPIAK